MNVPCHGCTERKIGCHGNCPRYAEYRAEREETYKKRRDALLIDEFSPGMSRLQKKRARRRMQNR